MTQRLRGWVYIRGNHAPRDQFKFEGDPDDVNVTAVAREAMLEQVSIDYEVREINAGGVVGQTLEVVGAVETQIVGSRVEFRRYLDIETRDEDIEAEVLGYVNTLLVWGWARVD